MGGTQAAFPTPLVGYTDAWSYTAGSEVTAYVSGDGGSVEISLIRLDRGLDEHNRPPSGFERIEWAAEGRYPLIQQTHCTGSFLAARSANEEPLGSGSAGAGFALGAWVWLAAGLEGLQAVLSVELGADELGADETGADEPGAAGTGAAPGGPHRELVLGLSDGAPALWISDGTGGRTPLLVADEALTTNAWHLLTASYDDGEPVLRSSPKEPLLGRSLTASAASPAEAASAAQGLRIAASARVTGAASFGAVARADAELAIGTAADHFTGKLDSPFISSTPLSEQDRAAILGGDVVAERLEGRLAGLWSLAQRDGRGDDRGQGRAEVREAVGGSGAGSTAARLVNQPMRAVTGRAWAGSPQVFADAPEAYDAVYFHRSDLGDVGWKPTFSAALPEDLPSGVYAIALRGAGAAGAAEDMIPIYVVPGARAEQRVALIVPTFTYLAYANNVLHTGGFDMSRVSDMPVIIDQVDQDRVGHPAYGLSLYDLHPDGTGVSLASIARPIVTERPGKRAWLTDSARHLSGDLNVVDWLHRNGIEHDIVTDLEVHRRGAELLGQYDVVLTGGHPEYCTSDMLDGIERYRDTGGNFLYLGGNGFYWVAGVVSERPLTIEIRRGNTAIRAWSSAPGEVHLSSTGEHGGMWRETGRAPQRLVGVGMSAQGWGKSSPYRVNRDLPSEHAWLLDGIEGELIGENGRVMGGAAGDEIDRADRALGTPLDAVIVGTSFGHSNFYQRNLEELQGVEHAFHGGDVDPEVHADIVYFEAPGGGSVFSVGSIAWTGALLPEGGDANVSRLTRNVIEHGLRAAAARRG